MRQLTNEARVEQTRLLCLAKRKKPIGQILNVIIPKSWQELPDKELRFVFRLLQGEYSLTQIKTLCLLRWGQLKVVRREGAVFIVRHHKKNYPLTTLQICEVCGLARANEAGFNGRAQANSNVVQSTEALAWLSDFPQSQSDCRGLGFTALSGLIFRMSVSGISWHLIISIKGISRHSAKSCCMTWHLS